MISTLPVVLTGSERSMGRRPNESTRESEIEAVSLAIPRQQAGV